MIIHDEYAACCYAFTRRTFITCGSGCLWFSVANKSLNRLLPAFRERGLQKEAENAALAYVSSPFSVATEAQRHGEMMRERQTEVVIDFCFSLSPRLCG